MEFETQEEILSALSLAASHLNSLFPLDCLVAVSDGEKFIQVYPGKKFDPGIRSGDPVSSDGLIPRVMQTGKTLSSELSADVYGVPLKTTTVPVRDRKGKIIGTLDIAFDLSTQNEMVEIAEKVAASSQEVSASCEELTAAVEGLKDFQEEMREVGRKAESHLEKTDEILSMIKNVASQTNLLGINAAVEASRAGEQGKGFAVVAQGIRDLSEKTSVSTDDITQMLREINVFFQDISQHMEENKKIIQEVSGAIKEIASSMEENSVVASKLLSMSRIL